MRSSYRLMVAAGLFALPAAWLPLHAVDAARAPGILFAAAPPPDGYSLLPGMPPLLDPNNVYSADRPGMLSPAVNGVPYRVYVPNSKSDTVDIIDPGTYKIIGHFALPKHSKHLLEPQHVVPSWDLKKLWVAQDLGDQLTLIDPATGKEGETIHVDDPYNMYYTPDGKYAVVMAEREKRLDFRDAQTMKIVNRVPVACEGVNHADFSPDGTYMIATCEFSSEIIKVDVAQQKVIGHLKLEPRGMPQDCRLSPDGKVFYIANMDANGVHVVDGNAFKQLEFIPTGKGAHGEYFSRDAKYMYVSNRGEGTVSLIDLATRKEATKWVIPGGGSPDMGGVSIDGKSLWLSGRYNNEVYVFDTSNGHLRARIRVGRDPHGLCVWPQPGRYSLGHTGNMR
ncbi:MAG TPA: cytochrome D1 domain-containing protein [Bryobacteraceae bacterium]|nr:cytochrome D1 domain-containing protein [Bryobacteraceae bacterium]HXR76712.1 cytochrome D1 domain-containing protein [Bryobacteraceae bacterium]